MVMIDLIAMTIAMVTKDDRGTVVMVIIVKGTVVVLRGGVVETITMVTTIGVGITTTTTIMGRTVTTATVTVVATIAVATTIADLNIQETEMISLGSLDLLL